MSKKDIKGRIDEFIEEKIITEKLEDIVGDRFGKYSKYIIQDRALPDARDGLKPVQRRILYAMYKMGMGSDKPYKKSARIAGEVMGKYHPHGDSSIYEAMVRMSQYFKMGVTLIDMHGNNGSIDGDSAAAMRYTEARLSKEAEALLADIEKRTVPFIPNFDDEELEPTVLPAKFPNLLVNGASGISSGYATKIPPHNLKEVIKATIEKIDKPNVSIDRILQIVTGPDFPTGAIVQGKEGIRQALETGAGKVIIRSKTVYEQMAKDQTRIVVQEIPYEVNKADLVRSIDLLRVDKKLEDILEVRDESDREGLRISIELKKGANADMVLNYMLKNTELQVNYNYNMVAISHQRPVQMGIMEILDSYINHQKEVVTNRSNYDLNKAEKRLHIVSGLIKMVDIVEEVIKTIRHSKNKANSKDNLMKQFDFTELQAEAIVTLQLYRLSSTDIDQLIKESNELTERIAWLKDILSDEQKLLSVIKKELREVSNKLGTERKTLVEDEIESIKIEKADLIADEQVRVGVTKDGYIKRSNLRSYIASKQPGLKENDGMLFNQEVSTKDTLLMFTTKGNYIFMPVYELEETKWKDLGAYINNIIAIEKDEYIIKVFSVSDFEANQYFLLTTEQGLIKQVLLNDFLVTRYSKTIRAMKVAKDDELTSVELGPKSNVIVFTKRAQVLRFPASEVPIYGTQSGGIKSLKITSDDKVVKAIYVTSSDDFLVLTHLGNIRRERVANIPLNKRLRTPITLFSERKKNPHFIRDVARLTVQQEKENVMILISCKKGSIELPISELKASVAEYGRTYVHDEEYGKALFINIEKPNENVEEQDILDVGEMIQETTKKEPKEKKNVDYVKKEQTVEETDEKIEEKKIHIKKLSLFDEDDWKE